MGQTRYQSKTTDLKRTLFRQAWSIAKKNQRTLADQLTEFVVCILPVIEGGQVLQKSASNNHQAEYSIPGMGALPPQELLEVYEELKRRCEVGRSELMFCARYGLDIWQLENCIAFIQSPLPAPVDPPITIDLTGEWQSLCDEYSEDPAAVIDVPVSDTTVFVFVLTGLVAMKEQYQDNGPIRWNQRGVYV